MFKIVIHIFLVLERNFIKSMLRQESKTHIKVLTKFLVTTVILIFLSIFFTFGLKDYLFHESNGIVTKAILSIGGIGSLIDNNSNNYVPSQNFVPIHKFSNSSFLLHSTPIDFTPNIIYLQNDLKKNIGRSILSIQDAEDGENSCDEIESIINPDTNTTFSSAEKCEFVKTSCSENPVYIVYYCFLENGIGITWIARIIFYIFGAYGVLMMFFVLADTADSFFGPSLLKLSGYLKLPPNLAGVTLLALGSGAPELCSIVAGLVNNNSDLAFAVPVGGGIFVTSVVVGSVAICSTVRVARRPFLRDVFAYLIAVCFMFVVYLDRRVRLFEGIICFILYILYVSTVVVGRFIYQTRKKRRLMREKMKMQIKSQIDTPFLTDIAENELEEVIESEDARGIYFSKPVFESEADLSTQIKEIGGIFVPKLGFILPEKSGSGLAVTKSENVNQLQSQALDDGKVEEIFSDNEKTQEDVTQIISNYFAVYDLENDDDLPQKTTFKSTLYKIYAATGLPEMSIVGKIAFFMGSWFWSLIRLISIPKSEISEWNKFLAIITPIGGTIFLTHIIFELFRLYRQWQWWMLALWIVPNIFALLFSIFVLITAERKKAPIYFPIFPFFAFILCMAWIFFAADNLVKILEVIGTTLKIPPSVLGITVLAWGNSVGDMISNIVVARAGYATMAIGASYASPLLNAMIGLGMSFTFNSIKEFIKNPSKGVWSGFCFQVDGDATLTVTFSFLIITLALSLVCVPIMRFRIIKPFALILYTIYIIYIILAILAALVPPIRDLVLKIKFFNDAQC